MIDRFAGKTRIVLGGRRRDDAVILGLGGYAVLVLSVLLVLMLRNPERPWGIVAFLVLAILWIGWMARGAIARLRDDRPWLVADTEGLRLHPTVAPDLVPWSMIHGQSIQKSRRASVSPVLQVLVRQPVRSLASPLGAIDIRVGLSHLGLTEESAANLVRQLERLRAGEA